MGALSRPGSLCAFFSGGIMTGIIKDSSGAPVAYGLSGYRGGHYLFEIKGILILFIAMLLVTVPVSGADHVINTGQSINQTVANAADGDTITLNPGTYNQHDIVISKNIIIRANESLGGNAENTIINGDSIGGIFSLTAGYSLDIANLKLKDGMAVAHGGGIYSNGGNVSAASCVFNNCSADGPGGGIYLYGGNVSLTSCVFNECTTNLFGGGIWFYGIGVTLDLTDCTFTSCTAVRGGAINGDPVAATRCIFSGCSASHGGGIYSLGVNLTDCTFTACTAEIGGGVWSSGINNNVTSCNFTVCSATDTGGCLYIGGTNSLTSCTLTESSAGTGSAVYSGGGSNINIHFCRIWNCTGTAVYDDGGTVNAENNWWCSGDDLPLNIHGNVDADPWLLSTVTTVPIEITKTGTSLITVKIIRNSDGQDTSGIGHIPDGTPVTFVNTNEDKGSLSVNVNTTVNGVSQSTFTAGGVPGSATLDIIIDGCTHGTPISILGANFSADPVTGNVPMVVTFTDSSNAGGLPKSWNWSFGDDEWYNSTSSMNPVHTYSVAGTYTVNLTVTGSFGIDTLTRTNYISVNTAPQPAVAGSGGSSCGDRGLNTDTGGGFVQDLEAGSSASFAMDKGSVNNVMVTAATDVGQVMITVKSTNSLPSSIDPPADAVYEYEDVTIYYTDNSALSGGEFSFSVPKSWVVSNGYNMGDIVMMHYNEGAGEWEELTTTLTGEEGGYYYYNAETPSFSWFAVAVSEGATIVPELAGSTSAGVAMSTQASSIAKSVVELASTESTVASGNQESLEEVLSLTSLAIPVIIVTLVVFVIAGIAGRKRREKYPDWWDHGKGRR